MFDSTIAFLSNIRLRLHAHIGTEAARFDQWRPPDYKERLQRIDDQLSLKADRADFLEGYSAKADRSMVDQMVQLQVQMQRQLEAVGSCALGLTKMQLSGGDGAAQS